MKRSCLTTLSDGVQRIKYGGMHVDVVNTTAGVVRVGSMPEISKFLTEHNIHDEIVVVPDWEVSMAGDNRTGEEFILWKAEIENTPPKEYVGTRHNVEQLYNHLDRIFPYFFDESCLSIVRTQWLDKWFHINFAEPNFEKDEMEIQFSDENIVIFDNGRVIYNRNELIPDTCIDTVIETLLAEIPRDNTPRDFMEITPIGCGNGFHDTPANMLIRIGEHVIWIDPCGYPAHSLGHHNIHWDDVTHYLFTHNHEDHVQGFTACLHRAYTQGRTLNLLIAENVFTLLEELYAPFFSDLAGHVNIQTLSPGTALALDSLTIESRWNHHILPYGTIGLKLTAGSRSFGYSGDTKYDEKLNSILQRKELNADWFASCDLIFHEIDFNTPDSVHTYWKQVASLQQNIPGKVLGYHTLYKEDSPFPLVKEGHRYLLDDSFKA